MRPDPPDARAVPTPDYESLAELEILLPSYSWQPNGDRDTDSLPWQDAMTLPPADDTDDTDDGGDWTGSWFDDDDTDDGGDDADDERK